MTAPAPTRTPLPAAGFYPSFDALPAPAQSAIQHWNRQEGADLPALHRAAGHTYTIEHTPAEAMKARIMTDPDLAADWPDFDTYHAWYLSLGAIPNHTERWPVIAGTGGEPLDDGWHRLHHYLRSGDPVIAVLHVHRPGA